MDPMAAQLLRRYSIAGAFIAVGVIAGVLIAQRQHVADYPLRELPAVPCYEACAKRASCSADAARDQTRCSALCHARASAHPAEALAENRCVLERPCAGLAACAAAR